MVAEAYKSQLDYKKAIQIYSEILDENYSTEAFKGLVDIAKITSSPEIVLPYSSLALDKHPQGLEKVDLIANIGFFYSRSGQLEKADSILKLGLESFGNNPNTYKKIGDAYANSNMIKRAIKVYEEGNKKFQNRIFSESLVKIYSIQNDYKKAVPLILEEIEYTRNISAAIGLLSSFSDKNEAFAYIGESIKSKEKGRDNLLFTELLLWYQKFVGDYSGAFQSILKLDKLKNGNGSQIYSYATRAIRDGEHQLALKAYKHLLEEGKNGKYYNASLMGVAKATELSISDGGELSITESKKLLDIYMEVIDDGKRGSDMNVAYLEAIKLLLNPIQDTTKALELIGDLDEKSPSNYQNHSSQMLLGDIYLKRGDFSKSLSIYQNAYQRFSRYVRQDDIADAELSTLMTLLYSKQFDKVGNKIEDLTKLNIYDASNDGLEIKNIVTLVNDTSRLEVYSEAKYAEFLGDDDEIERKYLKLTEGKDLLTNLAYIQLGELYFEQRNYDKSREYAQSLLKKGNYNPYSENAMLLIAKSYEEENNDQAAFDEYNRFLIEFPDSIHAVEIRSKAREIRERLKQKS
ncbi:MAG: hypothetical protein Kapaf2KO_06060 [Candidatus Kapaibacteriales bacterium]